MEQIESMGKSDSALADAVSKCNEMADERDLVKGEKHALENEKS